MNVIGGIFFIQRLAVTAKKEENIIKERVNFD
jgi:hypothetical protein